MHLRVLALLLGLAVLPSVALAQASALAAGTIRGRVFNPNAGDYLRDAQVQLIETGQVTVTGPGGEFVLAPVPAGRATVVVTYTGYREARDSFEVAAGQTVERQINVVTALAETKDASVVRMGQFVVSSEREGNAKAIMQQRNSMNLTNTVASDSFGDNAEGNIGEFLRNMPGVELDLFYGEVRNVRLRGLSSEYTSVTVDGVALASADANAGAAGNARAFTMEMASLNSMESIEVSKTVSADVDANAPAGTINLRTKRAFDRAGRRVSWQANVAAHSEEFSLRATPGPNDRGSTHKLRPGGIFEYSDIFLNRRLGVIINVSESNVYQETMISTLTYNRTPTTTDFRPEVITALSFQHAPRFNKRFATTLTADYKVTPTLAVSMGLVYNYADLWTPQRTVTFNTGSRALVTGDPYVDFTTNSTAANVVASPVAVAKLGETTTLLPKFFYKAGNLELEGKAALSDATSWYNPLARRHAVRDANSPTANGVNFRVTRPSAQSNAWTITQISGPDIASGSSYSYASGTAAVSLNDGRFSRSDLASVELNATLRTAGALPVIWKAGLKERYELRKFEDDQLTRRADYLGAGTTPIISAPWANYRSPYEYDFGLTNGTIRTPSGGRVFMTDLGRLADLYDANPSAFRQNLSAANYYTASIANHRRFEEEIRAAFLMADTIVQRVKLRLGWRWEDTATTSTEFDPRPPAEVRAAGYAVSSGRATTIPGLQYQYFSQPKVRRQGGFDNLFPSGSLKVSLSEGLSLLAGFSNTIKRATYANLSGVWSVNDVNKTVTSPNPNLKPETSRNYAARLAYYFEPVGQLSVSVFQNNVRDLHLSNTLTAEEFGNTDPDYTDYLFVTTDNSSQQVRIRGLEFEYSQSLSFLPQPFKRLSVRAAYTRNYAEIITPNLTPHSVSSGLNYAYGRFAGNVNWTWAHDVPLSTTGLSYRRHRANLDAGASWRLTSRVSLSVNARNLTNSPYLNMQWVAPSAPVWTRNETTGTSWTFAVKGTY